MKKWLVGLLTLACVAATSFAEGTASLPVEESYTASQDWTALTGFSGSGVGSYGDGRCKFDSSKDWLMVQFDGTPGELSFELKGNTASSGTEPASFVVEESSDGTTWSQLADLDETKISSSEYTSFSYSLSSESRYVRWTLANKYGFNFGLNNVKITSGGPAEFSVTFDKENWFKVALGQASSVTAIPKNGIEPYTFLWDSDTPELKGGTTDTLEIPATLAEGDYTVACLVTEDNGEGDAINALIGFTVEAVPVITGGSATYTVKTKSSVEASGDVPTGSSAAYAQTANNAGQITSNNTATLTLSGYTGMTITGLTLSMKSNASKGAGSLSVTCGDAIIASIEDSKFNTANWNGDWSTEYVDIKPAVNATAVDGDVVITIAASENSLYCQSYTVQFEAGDPQFSVTFDKENWFQVPLGEASSVTAIPKNGIEPYTFLWDSDTPALAGGTTDTLEIPATLAEGDYTVACLVTEDNGAGDAINALIGFKVVAPAVKYPITVAEGIVNGSVSVDKAEAEEGETVTVTATPETGYALEAITVNGIAISATTFPMPAEPVEVGATFAEVRDYAELPFVAEDTPYSGPWKGATVSGLTSKGLGNDYTSGGAVGARLDDTGDWLQIKFQGTAGELSYGIKGNSLSEEKPSTFKVQESADGETWADLATFTTGDNLTGSTVGYTNEVSATSQFVRFFYETKGAGNVGIYDVYISSGGPAVFSITLDPATDFDVEQNAEAFVTATPKHAEGIVGYAWWIDGTPVDTDGNVLALATGELGQHKVICEATDGAGATADAHVIYTVVEPAVKYQVQVAVGIPNGSVAADKAEAEEGELVTLSATPEAGYKLETYLVDGEPIDGNSFNMPAHDVEVSARFEEKPPVTGDVLTNDDVGSQSSSYVEWTATKESGAEYAGQSAGGSKDNPCIQLRTTGSNSGIVMTKSAGSDVASVTVEWNDATSDGRTIQIYGSADPYTSPADLYAPSSQGTLLGTLAKGEATLEVPEGYAYIGIRSSSGALYLTSVAIEFGGASSPSIAYTGETEVTLPDGAFSIAFTLKNYVGAYGWTLAGEGSLSDDGVYTWTPSEPGDYTIKVSAVNEEELIADKELTLKVNAAVVKYPITVERVPGGVLSVDKDEAEAGETVTVSAQPDEGMRLVSIIVNGQTISGTSFTMPAEPVTVSGTFEEFEVPPYYFQFETGANFAYAATEAEFDNTGSTAEAEPTVKFALQRTYRGKDDNDKKVGEYALRMAPIGETNSYAYNMTAFSEAITGISFQYGLYGASDKCDSFTVSTSEDGENWTVLADLTETATTELQTFESSELPDNVLFVRFDVANTVKGNTRRMDIDEIMLWTGAPSPKIVLTGGETTIELGESFDLNFELKNYDGASEWALDGEGSIADDGLYTWTPGQDDVGTHTIKVSAVNGEELIASKEVTLTVTEPGPQPGEPAIQIAGPDTGVVGQELSCTVWAINMEDTTVYGGNAEGTFFEGPEGTTAEQTIVTSDPLETVSFKPDLPGEYVFHFNAGPEDNPIYDDWTITVADGPGPQPTGFKITGLTKTGDNLVLTFEGEGAPAVAGTESLNPQDWQEIPGAAISGNTATVPMGAQRYIRIQ